MNLLLETNSSFIVYTGLWILLLVDRLVVGFQSGFVVVWNYCISFLLFQIYQILSNSLIKSFNALLRLYAQRTNVIQSANINLF